jgi:hypothetical protein
MIRYGMVRPAGAGPDSKLEKKALRSLPGNLTKYWLVGVFEGREKIADLFIVDETTLISGPKTDLWNLAALIWNEDWTVIEQRHVEGGRIWIFKLRRGSEESSVSIFMATTFRVEGADVVALLPEIPHSIPVDKKHWLGARKLARQLNPSINTEEGKLVCRLEQVEGEIELLTEEKATLIMQIGHDGTGLRRAISKP